MPGQRSWKDWLSSDGGEARRFREVNDVAWCGACGGIKLNTFFARANFAINATSRNGGYDWYCPGCQRFYEWDHVGQRFDDITRDWMDDYAHCVYCRSCGGPLAVEAVHPPKYRCSSCDAVIDVDLKQIRRAALDPW